ncbi:alpha amylase C-terminal domain-containing protein, partial [Desulfobulbus sp. F3]|nr:alpha amylase C-terminal domain-containing protein [Desulfobulbus sp. F3]
KSLPGAAVLTSLKLLIPASQFGAGPPANPRNTQHSHRWENGGSGDDVVVVVNFANRSYDSYTLGMPSASIWLMRFNSDWQGYSEDFGNHPGYDTDAGGYSTDNMPFQANIGIVPYSCADFVARQLAMKAHICANL